MSSLRTLLTYGTLERRRTETVPGMLIRSNTLDIVNMNTLLRQNTEVYESEQPKVPNLICLFQNWPKHFKWYN